jgi:hypothetical protein
MKRKKRQCTQTDRKNANQRYCLLQAIVNLIYKSTPTELIRVCFSFTTGQPSGSTPEAALRKAIAGSRPASGEFLIDDSKPERARL